MNLKEVRRELSEAMRAVPSVQGRTYQYPEYTMSPPCAFVGFAERTFDSTYGRGSDRVSLTAVVLVPAVVISSAVDMVDEYCAGSGDESIKSAIEAYTYTSFDSVRVESAETREYILNDVTYLAAEFPLDIIGPGTT